MITPKKRSEFERNLSILAESIHQGTYHSGPFPRTIRGLRNARKLPNNRLALLTIDETTRLSANTLANMPFMNMPINNDNNNGE